MLIEAPLLADYNLDVKVMSRTVILSTSIPTEIWTALEAVRERESKRLGFRVSRTRAVVEVLAAGLRALNAGAR